MSWNILKKKVLENVMERLEASGRAISSIFLKPLEKHLGKNILLKFLCLALLLHNVYVCAAIT
jgi:hypothetical protein